MTMQDLEIQVGPLPDPITSYGMMTQNLIFQCIYQGEKKVFFGDLLHQYLPKITLPWSTDGTILRGERFYLRIDQSEHTLTQVADLIVEGNSELAEFQPGVAVVATWIFGLFDSRFSNAQRMDKVSCYHCS